MKKTSKALLLALCAVLLVTASVLGTMAYLTAEDKVVNTFTVGDIAITMDESDVTAEDPETAPRVDTNSYKLLPGHTYTKDPIIHVTQGSEDCYLFVKVANEITPIEGATTVADQMKAKGWTVVDAGKGLYVYGAADTPTVVKYSENPDVPVFDTFTVKGDVNNETLATYKGKTITVTAYAIQADGFSNKSASEIWNTAGLDA